MNIFAIMILLRIQALLLAFILTMPIVFSLVTNLGNADYQIEFCDNVPEEEREERETEKDKEKDGIEEYVLRYQSQMGIFCSPNSDYSPANNLLASLSGDVLTPPPEFI